jgi:Cytochrome c554 and c-prime
VLVRRDKHLRKCTLTLPLVCIVAMISSVFEALEPGSTALANQNSAVSQADPGATLPSGFAGDTACRECHQEKFDSYRATAHHRTSRLPNSESIAGHFSAHENLMTTFNPELSFRMESRDGHFYESAVVSKPGHAHKRTEEIDIVIGSGNKGQTYLYWKGNRLFELPVSYWTPLKRWVNSPGYVDGSADFDRPVTSRCVECHATYFQKLTSTPLDNQYNKDNIVLGISCERCHGPGLSHIQNHAGKGANAGSLAPMPPSGLARDREIDICAQCHGGVGQSLAPAFSFQPGEDLSKTILLQQPTSPKQVDVHGNQVILLQRSRCFLSSPDMSCSTCHDVHSAERPAASYSAQCLHCHRQQQCGMFVRLGAQIATNCIDCHMPIQESKLLVLDTDDTRLKAKVRNHWIGIYPEHLVP